MSLLCDFKTVIQSILRIFFTNMKKYQFYFFVEFAYLNAALMIDNLYVDNKTLSLYVPFKHY